MKNQKVTVAAVIAVVIGLGGSVALMSRAGAQPPSGGTAREHAHDHEEEGRTEAERETQSHDAAQEGQHDPDEHERGGAAGHDEHDDHSDESTVRLSREERDRFGIMVATAGSGKLTTQIRLPGEIVLNADRVAHIVPRAPGIVREVLISVGDTVRTDEVMAWLESAELGEAKVDYLAKWAEVGCCTMDLKRAQAVHDNTLRLLELLDSSPSLETLREMNGSEMGENRSVLVSAFAELTYAEAAYLRERPLFEKKVASERDYQAAEAEYKKADALYEATRDSISFKVRRDLLEAKQARQIRGIELKGARRRLYVLGLNLEEIAELEVLARAGNGPVSPETECDDPNCENCKRAAASAREVLGAVARQTEERLGWYPLRAPFDGTVIEKHLTLGEKRSDDSGVFTIADLSSVWVNIAVYQKDLSYVREGMEVTVSAGADMPYAHGAIEYVAPVLDERTRTAQARVVLSNPNGELRPGLFVNAEIPIGQEGTPVVIPKSAVQRMGEEPVVFLETPEGFKPVVVSLGRSNDSRVEVLSGLAVGRRYVTQGAFELKAKIVTSGLDAHAGHGH